jgi:hypothetical protein
MLGDDAGHAPSAGRQRETGKKIERIPVLGRPPRPAQANLVQLLPAAERCAAGRALQALAGKLAPRWDSSGSTKLILLLLTCCRLLQQELGAARP